MNAVMHKKDGDPEVANKVKQRNPFKGTRPPGKTTKKKTKVKMTSNVYAVEI